MVDKVSVDELMNELFGQILFDCLHHVFATEFKIHFKDSSFWREKYQGRNACYLVLFHGNLLRVYDLWPRHSFLFNGFGLTDCLMLDEMM